MFELMLILALEVPVALTPCDAALLEEPVRTPMSVPPAIKDLAGALERIQRASRSVGGVSGVSARVWFLIDGDGVVATARLDRSTGSEVADSAALRAARSFRFHPAELNNEPVCVWIRLPIRFP